MGEEASHCEHHVREILGEPLAAECEEAPICVTGCEGTDAIATEGNESEVQLLPSTTGLLSQPSMAPSCPPWSGEASVQKTEEAASVAEYESPLRKLTVNLLKTYKRINEVCVPYAEGSSYNWGTYLLGITHSCPCYCARLFLAIIESVVCAVHLLGAIC